ncbi:glycoside hydrolase family 13 protein [Heterobasidion irregulare TC 32-1]|uniref:Glycoside hydrolase family 13 protein n=1 Tax=Heterobasidion irregulare (strain TC 32-1) TaxID=747525 RepID=W4KBD4_HETIT|nr:glycoside hydrolase family 13 protein [Heterobasidion irregulare TC 32-1]ETW83039.1 glycoside hydrolase family 13 protein [Heterobasidion irregulare TC 32-1]
MVIKCIPWHHLGTSNRLDGSLSKMDLGPRKNSRNSLMIQFFTWDTLHPNMSWWAHFEQEVPNLADLGVTQVWLPPPNKATHQLGQGYDAYDLWDLGEFEQKGSVSTRWGTKQELLRAISVAKANGIDVMIDAVLNHKLGADRVETFLAVRVDSDNRLKDLGPVTEINGWTAFDFPGRAGKYSSMRWNHEHFTAGLDWDDRSRTQGIYRIAGDSNKKWSPNVDKEFGNYDYLLGVDIDHRHPDVRKDLVNWADWVLGTTGATGFRLDAIKHMDRRFLSDWIRRVRQGPKRSRAFIVGEYWSGNVKLILSYIRAFKGQLAFFDVPLHSNFHEASQRGPKYDLRRILDASVLKARPGDAVIFQIGQTLQSWVCQAICVQFYALNPLQVDSNFKLQAYALILLRGEGHPCVFYGDLYPNHECYDEHTARGLRVLMRIRKQFAHGSLREYLHHPNCIGFVRTGDPEHGGGCVVVISNARPEARTNDHSHLIRMNVGPHHTSTAYVGAFAPFARVDITKDGWGFFSCQPGSIQVWTLIDPEP